MKQIDIPAILKKDGLKFPMLIWSELDNTSKVYLAASATEVKEISSVNKHNLTSLLLKLQEIGNFKGYMAAADMGDPSMYPMDIMTLEDPLNWDKLIKDFEEVVNNFKADPKFEKLLNEALEEYYKADVAAATLDAIYSSILYYMISQGQELGINNLAFLGDIIYQGRFSGIVEKHLPEEMEIIFLDK